MIAFAALLAAGCEGAELRENLLRPPKPVSVSVEIGADRVTASPRAVAFEEPSRVEILDGPEPEQIPTDPGLPLPTELTIVNGTEEPARIVLTGPGRHVSPPVTASGTVAMSADLETGTYQVRVAGDREVGPGIIRIGPLRFSPQNDLTLP